MELQFAIPKLRKHYLSKMVQSLWFSPPSGSLVVSTEADNIASADVLVDPVDAEGVEDKYLEEDYDSESGTARRRSKKRRIYCFNCNRQEFHIMAYKGTMIHSFLVGMTFGLARIFGPYRCTCCGKKRGMFADFCSISYHLRMASERRLSKTGRRRSSSSRSRSSSRRR